MQHTGTHQDVVNECSTKNFYCSRTFDKFVIESNLNFLVFKHKRLWLDLKLFHKIWSVWNCNDKELASISSDCVLETNHEELSIGTLKSSNIFF